MRWNKVGEYVHNPCKIVNYLRGRGRLKFLRVELYLKLKYYACMEKKLNLKNPTFGVILRHYQYKFGYENTSLTYQIGKDI